MDKADIGYYFCKRVSLAAAKTLADTMNVRRRPRVLAWLYRSSVAVLVGLAASLALERQR